MLLREFFESPEGEHANNKATPPTTEGKRKITAKNDPCWTGYKMVGTKNKGGKEVPNCISDSKKVIEDQWSGANNAWHNGPQDDQWYDGQGQWSESLEETDTINLNTSLLIRLLEYAQRNTNIDLNIIVSQLVKLSQENCSLTIKDYDKIFSIKE